VIAAAAVLLGYLVGSLPTGLVVIRLLKGIDIRAHGSGNIGATNVFRVAGLPTAALVLLLDMAKGAVPVLSFIKAIRRKFLFLIRIRQRDGTSGIT